MMAPAMDSKIPEASDASRRHVDAKYRRLVSAINSAAAELARINQTPNCSRAEWLAAVDKAAAILNRFNAGADCASAHNFLSLSDQEKRHFFAHSIAESDRLKRAERELEEARKDVARLDSRKIRIEGRNEFGEPCATVHYDIDLRAAIDAAQKKDTTP